MRVRDRFTENWKVIQDRRGVQYDDYEISDCGRVRRRRPSRLLPAGAPIAPIQGSVGYLVVNLSREGRQSSLGVHVLVCASFNGLPKPGQTVTRHLDGNKQNNRLDNLTWGTHRENARDAVQHGRIARGASHPKGRAKLSAGQVALIKRLLNEGWRPAPIARMYGMTISAICHIRDGGTWAEVHPAEIRERTRTSLLSIASPSQT